MYYLLQKVKTYTWKPVVWMLLFHKVFITINILKSNCTLHCYRPVSTNPRKQSTYARTWCCSETPELMGTWELVPTKLSQNLLFHFWCFIWSFKKIPWIWDYVPTKFLNLPAPLLLFSNILTYCKCGASRWLLAYGDTISGNWGVLLGNQAADIAFWGLAHHCCAWSFFIGFYSTEALAVYQLYRRICPQPK